MAELAPGFSTSPRVPAGRALVFDVGTLGGESGIAGTGKAIVMAERDWERIPGAARERLLDDFTRKSALWGIGVLEQHLNGLIAKTDTSSQERATDV